MTLEVTKPEIMGRKAPIPPKLLSIKDTGRILGVGRTTVYELINSGALESRHLGHRHLVVYESIEELIDRLPNATLRSNGKDERQ